MKKCFVIAMLLALIAIPALAGVEAVDFSVPTISTNVATKTYVLRGVIESIYVNITAGTTSTVAIASDQGTIFSKAAITADAQYFPRAAAHTTVGAAQTWTEVGTELTGGNSNTVTTTYFHEKIAVAGPVTVTVTGSQLTTTNSAVITVIFDK